MKALAISLILFAVAITAVCINAAFIHSTAQEIKDLALSVVDGESEAINELTDYWNTKRNLVALTVGLREVDAVSEQIIKLCACSELEDENTIYINYVLLCDAIDDITRYEKISLAGIF